jgi:hypothetical protein
MCEPLDCLGRSRVGHRPQDQVLVVWLGAGQIMNFIKPFKLRH